MSMFIEGARAPQRRLRRVWLALTGAAAEAATYAGDRDHQDAVALDRLSEDSTHHQSLPDLEIASVMALPEELMARPGLRDRIVEVAAGRDALLPPGPSRGELPRMLG